jgi:hypothetical protein
MRDNRAAQEDEVGQLYLTNVDFLKNGVPASAIATLVRCSHRTLYSLVDGVPGGGHRRISHHATPRVSLH